MISTFTSKIYEFEDFRLVPAEGLLLRNGTPVDLNPKAFAVLAMLVEHNGHLVSKAEILNTIWEGAFIEEGAIAKAVWFARNALGDVSKEKFIKTVPRRGYRFVAAVSIVGGSGAFRLADLPTVENGTEEAGNGFSKPSPNVSDSNAYLFVKGGREQEVSQTSDVSEASPDRVNGNGNNYPIPAEPITGSVDLRAPTKRRKGLLRGTKFLLWGLGVWFVSNVLVQALLICGTMLAQYRDDTVAGAASSTAEMMGSLLFMIQIPVGLGMFAGIGLFIFGLGRLAYALFEKEDSRSYAAMFERVTTALIILAILAVAVPNLMFSYREASTASQIKRIPAGDKTSIAVLPLRPIDRANRNDMYEIGIADALIRHLSAANGILVRQLSATRKYTEIEQDPIAAGREQNVNYVLASNYQLADGTIQVTSQLINVANGQVEETYNAEKPAANLFSMQDAIANDIGKRLLAKFGSDTSDFRASRGTDNEEAYRWYMMAMNLSEERGIQNVQKALGYLEKAVGLDPNYAVAWAGIAHLHRDMVGGGDPDAKGHYEKSMEAIRKALAIDPNTSDAYSASCHNKNRYEYDAVGAEADCKRALELDSNSPQAHKTYANFLYSRGRFKEALEQIRAAMDLQPVSYRNQQIYGLTLFYARRFEEAEAQFKRLLELNPNHASIHGHLVTILDLQGKESEAFEYFIKGLTAAKTDDRTIERFQTTYAASGWLGVTRERISADADKTGSFQLACLYARIGDKDKAFEYLEKAYRERSFLMAILQVAPQLEPLRDDPRYAELVQRIEEK